MPNGINLYYNTRDIVHHGGHLFPPAPSVFAQPKSGFVNIPVGGLDGKVLNNLNRLIAVHNVPDAICGEDQELVPFADRVVDRLRLGGYPTLVNDAVSQRSAHSEPKSVASVLIPHASRSHRYRH